MTALGEFMDEFEVGAALGPSAAQRRGGLRAVEGLFGAGVYALTMAGEIVYVGKAKVLIQRLYSHWNTQCRWRSGKELPDRFKLIEFTGVRILPCNLMELDLLERQMIARYRPKQNKRLVPEGKLTLEQIGFDITRLGVTNVAQTPVYRRRL